MNGALPFRARLRYGAALTCRIRQKTPGLPGLSARPELRSETMPKRTDIKSILIIGAGPIIIGQACEFDYSGTQACKALKEEGYRIILVNSIRRRS